MVAPSLMVLGTASHVGESLVTVSAANFLLMKRPPGDPSASSLHERLIIEHRILIRDCNSYEGLEPGMYMLVAVKDGTANLKLLQALKEVLA